MGDCQRRYALALCSERNVDNVSLLEPSARLCCCIQFHDMQRGLRITPGKGKNGASTGGGETDGLGQPHRRCLVRWGAKRTERQHEEGKHLRGGGKARGNRSSFGTGKCLSVRRDRPLGLH